MHPRSRAARDALAALAARGWPVADAHDAALIARWCGAWTTSALDRAHAAAVAEGGEPRAPLDRVGVLLPGNVGIAAAQQIGEALLAGVGRLDVGVIDASGRGRRGLDAAERFVAALAEVDASVAARVHIATLPPDDEARARVWLEPLQALVAAGADATLARWRRWWADTEKERAARWQGHRVSVALWQPTIAPSSRSAALAREARAIAEDALVGDGGGCMSPRLVVLHAAQPQHVAPALDALAAALGQVGDAYPARTRTTAGAAAQRLHVDELALTMDLRLPGAGTWLLTGSAPPPSAAAEDALWALGPGHRALVVWALPADRGSAGLPGRHLAPLRRYLGTLSVAGDLDAAAFAVVAAEASDIGFVRVVRAGSAQAPGPSEVQDGATPLRVFWARGDVDR